MGAVLPSAFGPGQHRRLTRFSPVALTMPNRSGQLRLHFQAEAMGNSTASQ